MLSLDDEEGLIAERPVGAPDAPPGRKFNLRPVLMGLAVLVLGGGLGGAAYVLSNTDTRDVIALLDISDQPRLSLEIPGLSGSTPNAASPSGSGGLLTPPGPPVAPPPIPAEGLSGGIAPMPPTPTFKLPEPPAPPAPEPEVALPAPIPEQPLPRSAEQAPTYASLPARLTEPKPLPPAPIEALLRLGPNGPVPVVAKDGRQAWRAYARPFDAPAGKPRLAVIVTGLGLDKDATEAAITKLPAEVTLAFSPYAGGLDKWIKKARDLGHEVMLTLPAEPVGFPARDPGPWGLLTGNPVEENNARLERVLARGPGAVGVLAPEGPFTKAPAKLVPVLNQLKERGLLYVGEGAKPEHGLPMAGVSALLDVDLFRDALEARLGRAANAAKEAGSGVVVVAPRPVAFDRLVGWLDRLGEQGIALAPASAVVKQSAK
jgi:polysaccharide deacetylase 2 family uncharacterized protein YibQ